MTKRMDVEFLGRHLGTASGWEGEPGECYWFNDFEPAKGINLKPGDLLIHEIKGYIGSQNPEDGEFIEKQDIITLFSSIPRMEESK